MKQRKRYECAAAVVAVVMGASGLASGAFISDPFSGHAGDEAGAAWDDFTPTGMAVDAGDAFGPDLGTTPTGNEGDFSLVLVSGMAATTSTANIYSGAGAMEFSVASGYTGNFSTTTNPIQTVVFQVRTQGTELDYSSISLTYNGSISLAPSFSSELSRTTIVSPGGATSVVDYAVQFDLSGVSLSSLDFAVGFATAGPHSSLDAVQLDFSSAALTASVVPEPAAWMLVGLGGAGLLLFGSRRRRTAALGGGQLS